MDTTTLPPPTLIKNLVTWLDQIHQFSSKSISLVRARLQKKTSMSSLLSVAVHATMSAASVVAKPVNYYDVLRVKRNASLTEIKKAYRTLAKLYHPDSSSNMADSRDFMAVRDAYAALSDRTAGAWNSIRGGDHSGQRLGNFARSGYLHGLRWETDQCW